MWRGYWGKIGRLMAECAGGEFFIQLAEGFGDSGLEMIRGRVCGAWWEICLCFRLGTV